MDTTRLKVKIGLHEFEAEGPAEQVAEQFAIWKELISGSAAAAPVPPGQASMGMPVTLSPAPAQLGFVGSTPTVLMETGWNVFQVDDRRKIVTLKAHPQTERRDADAVLLCLYGFRRCMDVDDVLVGRLKDAMEASGLRPDRIDRTVDPYVREGLILKSGRGPGGRYRLTVTGQSRADQLARAIFQQIG